jgi:molybdate transport system substrate-binding protein
MTSRRHPRRARASRLAAAVLLAAAPGCGDGRAGAGGEEEVMVYAAESLRDAVHELADTFRADAGVRVRVNVGGSNFLARQLVAARGGDVFLSASERWMDDVEGAGRLVEGSRRALLSNRLVVVAHPESPVRLSTPCDLAAADFRFLALGDPEAVPAGIYAREWLESVTCGGRPLWEAVRERVAPTPDVRAALGLARAQRDVPAIVYRTDWLSSAGRTRVLLEVEDGPAIRYDVARVREGGAPEAGRRFFDVLTGPAGAAVFARHGFVVVDPGGGAP